MLEQNDTPLEHRSLSHRALLGAKAAAAVGALTITSCKGTMNMAGASSNTETFQKLWSDETIEHKGFKDLGHYVIALPDYTDSSVLAKGIALQNDRFDHGDISKIGCTSMATRNSKGEVIIGRNEDLEISQYPAYVYMTTCGKYRNYCVTYTPGSYKTYEEVKQLDELDEEWKSLLIFNATDCMNEKGLYVENNMRTSYPHLSNYGLHSARGEELREDGTPWKDLRACLMAFPQLATQNCATIKEAVQFLKNSYDWYTVGMPTNPHYDGWNFSFLMGDATGEYGLVEIAQDEVSYIPYQFGQANYYITPKWKAMDTCSSGEGRLHMVSQVLGTVDSLEEAMDAMKAIMWRNETLWIGESVRMDDAAHPNPYNQVVFQDDEGNPQLDWRSDYVQRWPVLDDGRLLVTNEMYAQAEESISYDPMIKQNFDDAIARGTLVVDDGSILFEVNEEQLTLTELIEKHEEYEASSADLEKQSQVSPHYEAYSHLLGNQNTLWGHDDRNFEALKAVAYAFLHTRTDDAGVFDLQGMSKYEKLLAFYGYGTERDETPLRDDASIWTTSLNIGVNCAEKKMKVRFWENDDVVCEMSF